MSRMRCPLSLGICLPLAVVLSTTGPLRGAGVKPVSKGGQVQRTDQHGDLLPEGAIARLGTNRLGHQGKVLRLAFTANGQALASLGDDCAFHLWETATGKELGRFQRQKPWADGNILKLQQDPNAPAKIQMLLRMQMLQAMELEGFAFPMAFSADGKLVAVADRGNAVWLWNLHGNKPMRQFEVKEATVNSLAFSPQGNMLAGADSTKGVHLWDLVTGKELRQMKSPNRHRTNLIFSPDGSLLAGVEQNEICLWDVDSGKRLRKFDGHEHGQVTALAFSPHGKLLASAGTDATIRLWELASEQELRIIPTQDTTAFALAFSPDGKVLASAGDQKVVRLWNLVTGKEIRQFTAHQSPVHALGFSPDGKTLASGSANGQIRFWEPATGKERFLTKRFPKISCVSVQAAGRTVTLGGEDGRSARWEIPAGKEMRRWKGPDGEKTALVFSPRGNLVAVVDDKLIIRLWDCVKGKEVRRCEGHQGPIVQMVFSPDAKVLASASQDQTIRLWSVATGKEIHEMKANNRDFLEVYSPLFNLVAGLTFSPDGKTLASVTADGKFRLWEITTGRERCHFKGQDSAAGTMAFSPDGRLLAASGSDEHIRLWNPATGKQVRAFLGHQGAVTALVFSPDGKWLATGSEDRTVRLWNVATAKELRCFQGHQAAVRALAFHPDGKTLVSGSDDTTALVWDLTAPPAKKQPPTEDSLSRNMASLWKDLASVDAALAFQAMAVMESKPETAVVILRKRLQPALGVEERRLAQLITDLDHQRYDVRQRATTELERLRGQGESALRKALAARPSAESQNRIKLLLQKLDKPDTSPEGLRRSRAVEVLEQIGTGEARQILSSLAKGAAEADLTREAKAALGRLAKRPLAKQ